LILNGLLIYLIYSRSTKALKDYKKVLYLGVVVDIIYSSISLLFAPTTLIYKDVYFVLLEGILGQLEEPMTTIGYVLNVFATYFCIATTQVQFIYRYLLICKNKKLNNFAFFGLVLTSVISCGLCGFTNYIGFGILTTSADLVYYQSLVEFTGWPEVLAGKRNYAATMIKYLNFIVYPITFVMLYSYVTIIFCGVSIHKILRIEASKYSKQNVKCQTQVSVILTIEAVFPVITVLIPTAVDWVASHLLYYPSWLGPVRKTVTCVAPLLNPIIKICVVGCYRAIVLRLMKKKFFVNITISPLALTLNGLLAYLIYTKTSIILKDYKKILYLGVIVDIIYSLISLLFAPTTLIYKDVYFVLLEGILGQMEEPMTTIGHVLNVFATYFCIATAQVQFIYRYLLICKNKKLDNLAFFGLVLTSVISSGLCGFVNYFAFQILNTSEDLVYYQSLLGPIGWSEILGSERNYAATRIVSIADLLIIYIPD
ncbi:hypothetical protein FO519_009681, partial [Halicephalobus sp. NKZ332]